MRLPFFCAAMIIALTISKLSYSDSALDTPASQGSSSESTVIEERTETESTATSTPGLISLYHPNYILPFYHTGSPYYEIYRDNTPNNQKVDRNEFKAQLSLIVPFFRNSNFFHRPFSMNVSYTQLMYWQVYAKSQYFRETNYEPELFAMMVLNPQVEMQLGVNHQSNGRGGILERSWNRLFYQLSLSGVDWLARFKVWTLIAKSESSSIHNPDIAHFLGYGNVLLAYQWDKLTLSGEVQNIESGFRRGFVMVSAAIPVSKKISVYVQFFNGYGQSLIEYNHRTSSAGVGISLNNIIN